MTFTRVNEEVAVINGARLVRYGRVDHFGPLSVTLTDGTRWRQADGSRGARVGVRSYPAIASSTPRAVGGLKGRHRHD